MQYRIVPYLYNLIFLFCLIILIKNHKGEGEGNNITMKLYFESIWDKLVRINVISGQGEKLDCSFLFVARNATRIDLMKCKLTQMGMEYRGTIAKTAGSIRCQSWYAEEPIHEVLFILSVVPFAHLKNYIFIILIIN